MKLRLLRDCRIRHLAGEIVEVSPAEAAFLISARSAEQAENTNEREIKKANVREIPEANIRETPEDSLTDRKPAVVNELIDDFMEKKPETVETKPRKATRKK